MLVAVVGATVVSAAFGLADEISTVGTLPQGFPTPALPWTQVSDVGPLFVAAVGITLVSLTDTIATSSAFAARRGEEVDPNQEMVGIGAANVAAGLVRGFAVSTSGSRTAVAEQSGAKSQLTGLIGAAVVAVLLLFLNDLLADLPTVGAGGGGDRGGPVPAERGRAGALLAGAALGGGALGDRLAGRDLRRACSKGSSWPSGSPCSCSSGAAGGPTAPCWDGSTASTAGTTSTLTTPPRRCRASSIYRWEAPLFFANAGAFRRQVRHLVRERSPSWVVVQCEAITDVDVTAAGMLQTARRGAQRRRRAHGLRRAAQPPAGARAALRAVRDTGPRSLLSQRRERTRRHSRSQRHDG